VRGIRETSTILRSKLAETHTKNTGQTPSHRIYEHARCILGTIKATSYQHQTQVYAKDGIYKVDCSGFVDYILEQVAPEHYRQIPYQSHGRPLARDFYDYFISLPTRDRGEIGGWCRIEKLRQAQRGDILAYKYTPQVRKIKGTTGHVLIFFSKPEKLENGEYLVLVVDSAQSAHGDDSHRDDQKTGIGRGKMWFGTDTNDHPIYYRWSELASPRNESNVEGIVIGRAL
jgi:hypothetical protein